MDVENVNQVMICGRLGKVDPVTGHEGPGGDHRLSYSLTSRLERGGSSKARTGCLTPGKKPDTYCIGGPRVGLNGCGKSHPPPGFDT
jgi:hypothetical protein